MIADTIWRSHLYSRMLLGTGLLALAISAHTFATAVLLSIATVIVIRVMDEGWMRLHRLARLLVWFVTPILLLHALFSPGELMFPGTFLPLTIEGSRHGGLLAVRLIGMFLTAMLMFRLLRHHEWLATVRKIPWAGQRLQTYIWLIHPLRQQLGYRLRQLHIQYQQRRQWRLLPHVLLAACLQSLNTSKQVAAAMWLRWPGHVQSAYHGELYACSPLPSLLLALIGLSCMLLVWL